MGSTVRASDRSRGSRGVPVGASGDDVVAANAASAEAEVVRRQRAGGRDDAREVAGDAAVEANATAGLASEVAAERAERRVELLKNYCLRLNFADLLSDDPKNRCNSQSCEDID